VQIGMIGLGRMGANMARRLIRGGHAVVGFATDQAAVRAVAADGGDGVPTLEALVAKLRKPRVAWLMVPAGAATEQVVLDLAERMEPGDSIVDGGNSFFKDDVRRMRRLQPLGIHYVDVGTSGGVWGLERGYCLMIGGEPEVVRRLEPIFQTLAPGPGEIPRTPGREALGGTAELGYLHCGPCGAGHFVKMVHNGIEYGLMQAYAEGFDILLNARTTALPPELRYELDVAAVAELWRRGSVVGSWLLDLTAMALAESPTLAGFEGSVQDSGEGRWTVLAAIEEGVPAEVLSSALYTRFRSRQAHTFAEKILSAMRSKFGGHVESPAGG
jgi:6-phosphogluconate dehydrogenase